MRMFNFQEYLNTNFGIWPHASMYINTLPQCSPASVGLDQAHPNNKQSYCSHCFYLQTPTQIDMSIAIDIKSSTCSPRTCANALHSPCLNNATCTDIASSYNCSCTENYFGAGCQYSDGCSSNPCQNDGTCFIDLTNVNQFTCMCVEGYEGTFCEALVSPCDSNLCSSGSTCIDGGDGVNFMCQCAPGFTGTLCDADINECDQNPCQNDGTCTNGINSFTCECPPEFSGPDCSVQVIFCRPDLCSNGGTCIEEPNGFSCTCPSGFTGPTCQENINECQLQDPCQNGASCMDLNGSFVCFCAEGFTGSRCEVQIDFCVGNPCGSNGACSSLNSTFECMCNPGFTGPQCGVEIDECDPNPCLNEATCIDSINLFTCVCPSGFSGIMCENDIDECSSNPCENGGTCQNSFGQFTCQCSLGFTGANCSIQIDFCAEEEQCFNGGTCSSIINGFTCNCPSGWTGDRCQHALSITTKLGSCGLPMADDVFSILGISSTTVAFTNSTSSIRGEFVASSFPNGFYWSGWIWQEGDTEATLFSLSDHTGPGTNTALVLNPATRELTFYYHSSALTQQQAITFSAVPIVANQWHHVTVAAATNGTISVAVDRMYLQTATGQNFSLSDMIDLMIGNNAGSLNLTAQPFLGIMRGVALDVLPANFDLAAVESCTLNCIAGESFCSNGGQCLDLFAADRQCLCPYGYTGPFCQYLHSQLSFGGGGFAQLPNATENLNSLQLSFKTESLFGEIFSHIGSTLQYTIKLQNGTLVVEVQYCDSTTDIFLLTKRTTPLNDLQQHFISVVYDANFTTLNVLLDTVVLSPPPSCDITTPRSLTLGGSRNSSSNFTGCITVNTTQVNATSLQLIGDTEFGCTHDTAQFFGQSYLKLPAFISREAQTISLDFNTQAADGVIYFSRRIPTEATPDPNDFVAIYIDEGRVVFSFNLGEMGQNVVIGNQNLVNDGQWHQLEAMQNGTMAFFTLDGVQTEATSMGPLSMLDTTGNTFLGGVPTGSQITQFTEYTPFIGCVRDLEQNRQAVDLQGYLATQNVRFGTCN